jgi:aspartyl-tRNA(Asn)/glutamyl-tRNA(Gln) amidotransferase subunit A
MARNSHDCKELLDVIVGHDDKDGTSLSEELCQSVKKRGELRRVAVLGSMEKGIDKSVEAKLCEFKATLRNNGVEVLEIEDDIISASRPAWNVLMSAELCNNVSRYDGVKYGYRAQNFSGIDELYTNSRTEAFGELLKKTILFGSDTLSTENYMKVYDKALRVRRVIVERFAEIFKDFDAVLMPACSVMEYTEDMVKENKSLPFEENFYTAPASISGLPAVVVGGVQLVGKAFSEGTLLGAAELYEKEGR